MLAEITAYLRRTGMPETRFGWLAARDPRLVGDLKKGRELRPQMAARIRAFMQDHPQGEQ